MQFSGLKIPPLPPVTVYQPKSKFLKKDLPCTPGGSALDLRLLPGNLDKPFEATKVVKETCACMDKQESEAIADSHVFLAGHAMGKTKAIFDIAALRFTVLLDASGNLQGQQDIKYLLTSLAEIAYSRQKYEHVRGYICALLIIVFVVLRFSCCSSWTSYGNLFGEAHCVAYP